MARAIKTQEPEPANDLGQARPGPGLHLGFLLVMIAIFVLAGLAVYALLPQAFLFSTDAMVAYVKGLGAWGHAAIIALMIVHSFIPFPGEFVALAAGMCFGIAWGSVLTWIGAMIGASISFGLVRWLGRPFVDAMLSPRQQKKLDLWTRDHGVSTLFFLRFLPIVAFNLINYAAGLTKIGWPVFLVTTGLGILPLTILMVALGSNMQHLSWVHWGLITVLAVGLWLLSVWGKSRFQRHTQSKSGGRV